MCVKGSYCLMYDVSFFHSSSICTMGNTIVQDTGIDGESASSSGCVAGATRRDSDDWITIPIFVSSHFKDFHAEREILVKQVSRG